MQLQSEKGEHKQKNSFYRVARIISMLFIPPVLTLFSFSFLGFSYEPSLDGKILVFGSTFLLTFLLPIVFFLLMLKKNKIVNQDAEVKEERTIPFLFGLSLLLIGYFFLRAHDIQPITLAFWFSYITNTAIIIIINKIWKISIHALGIAAPLVLFLYIGSWIAYPLTLLLYLVGWTRINLKCHTFTQVIAGAFFGFLSTYVQLYLFLK
ncbi:MAG: hypothetical protein COZ80_12090 [Ignavibacteria bacterium CG_4_8_14_3_um_filter_37_9]|nr:MAG: hypothetical protein COZ80_12090 [Ignavibacteria bacterium CG_4_8_14_3_um_filter_37_9]